MGHNIEFTPAALRQFKKLDRNTRRRIGRRIDALAENPRPDGVVKLTDVSPPLYRIREGDNRIVYVVEDGRLLVLVVRIAHRSDIYR